MKAPTRRQLFALRIIERHREKHGWAPTVRELCEALGVNSSNTGAGYIRALTAKGLLVRGEGARALALTDAGRKAVAA